jgi:hypothetical protein
MMAIRRWSFAVSAALLISVVPAGRCVAGDFPLWGKLPSGTHAVGFRSLWQFDYTRTYNMTFKDHTSYTTGKAPRPILINVWYPAQAREPGHPMRHRDYLAVTSDDPRLAKFSRELAAYERGVIAQEVMQQPIEKLTQRQLQLLGEFLDSPTACRRDAPPAAGKFPLVIYHAGFGSSFEDNAVLCEFLASHGFVVLGSAFQEPSGKTFNVDGQVTSGRDMDFLIAHARQQPNVDWQHIGVVGHSGGAHAALQFRAQPSCVVDAVVSLDTTQDYYSVAHPGWRQLTTTVADNRENFTGPLLIVANPHAFFAMCDSLDSSRRYYLTIKDLDHNDFISQGCLQNELRLKPGYAAGPAETDANVKAHAAAVRQGYEALCVYVLRFLEAKLKADKRARDYLATQYHQTPLGGSAPHVDYVPEGVAGAPPYRVGDPGSPTPRQLRPFLRELGVQKTIALLKRVRKDDPTSPLLHPVFAFALVDELLDRGKNQDGIALCGFYREAGHDVVKMLARHGDLYSRRGARDFAASCFRKVLVLDPGNADAAKKLADLEKPGG